MKQANRETLTRNLPLLIGAVPFLLTGVDAWFQGKPVFGTLHLLMAAANLVALRFIERVPGPTGAILQVCNAVVAWVVAYDYLLAGKKGLPYAWVVVGVAYLAAGWVMHRKARARESSPRAETGG